MTYYITGARLGEVLTATLRWLTPDGLTRPASRSTVIGSVSVDPVSWDVADANTGNSAVITLYSVPGIVAYAEWQADSGDWLVLPNGDLPGDRTVTLADGNHTIRIRWVAAQEGQLLAGNPSETREVVVTSPAGIPEITIGQFSTRQTTSGTRRIEVQHTVSLSNLYSLDLFFGPSDTVPGVGATTTDIRTSGLSPSWFTSVSTVPAGATRYIWVRVRRISDSTAGSWLRLNPVTISSAPTVSNISATKTGGNLTLSWDEVSDFTVTSREWRFNTGTVNSISTPPQTFASLAAAGDTIEIRAISVIGTGAWSSAIVSAGSGASFAAGTLTFGSSL